MYIVQGDNGKTESNSKYRQLHLKDPQKAIETFVLRDADDQESPRSIKEFHHQTFSEIKRKEKKN
jgi:hypothetical protein